MTAQLIAADRVVVATPGGPSTIVSPGLLRVEDGRIAAVGTGATEESGLDPGAGSSTVLSGGILVPGLVDLQVNGYFGHDAADADAAGWAEILRRLPETGVTAFLPTFITAPLPRLAATLSRTAKLLAEFRPEDGTAGGAHVLGVHLEGPFLSEKRAGAHDPRWFTDPASEALATLLDAAPGLVTMVTLAPERHGALEAVRTLTRLGVVAGIGHSDASAAQVAAAAHAGARMVTHLFNGQTGIDHREPGVAAQALVDDRLTCGLIADMAHVSPVVCALAFRAAAGRIALVTDAAAAAGMPPGRYDLGGQPIDLPAEGPPVRPDGTLAGSALRLDAAIGNIVDAGVDLTVAVDAATRVPADLIGRPDLGRIAPGAAADLVWLGPDFRTRATWIAGRLAAGGTP